MNKTRYNSGLINRKEFNLFDVYDNADIFLDFNQSFLNLEKNYVFTEGLNLKGEKKEFISSFIKDSDLKDKYFENVPEDCLQELETFYDIEFEKGGKIDLKYVRKNFIEEAKKSRKYRSFIKQNLNYELKTEYNLERIKEFYSKWMEQKGDKAKNKIDEMVFAIENKEKYGVELVFLEIDAELIGLAIGCRYSKDTNILVALHCYSIHKDRFKNVDSFLKVKRAEHSNLEYFLDSAFLKKDINSVLKYKLELADKCDLKKISLLKIK